MPFDAKYDQVYESLIAPACRKAGFIPKRADAPSASERITDHILKQLLESDIVLGDLTSRNPNVLYELGVRHACGGSTVLIQAAGTPRIFDIQDIRTIEYSPELVPPSLERDIERIAEQLASTHREGSDENLVFRTVGDLGYLGRQEEGYRSFLARLPEARSRVRVLVTFAYFLNDERLLTRVFRQVAESDGSARLLLVDPGSRAAAQRGYDRPGKDVPREIRSNLCSIARCADAASQALDDASIECKVYDMTPPFALFECDGRATLIFYEYRKDLRDTQSITFGMKTPLGRYVRSVFGEIWKNVDTSMAIDQYLSLRGWFGRALDNVRYLRGQECPAEGGVCPDMWLLVSHAQHREILSHLEDGRPVQLDDVSPGRYTVSSYPIDAIRRVAVQKYGEEVTRDLACALAATRQQQVASV
jgi:hypothetical protein